MVKANSGFNGNGDLNFTSKLWQTADKMRNNMDAAEDIKKISNTYHAFKGEGGKYEDIASFCKAATLEEIKKQGDILTPGRYVGTKETEEDDEIFE
ncbi:MAG: SAM-dependent methyltransferase [Deltaproteobacteria bacterium]|nr:SAM-dependent methyltransferase [Deltaproteobacteria bacterium]